MSRDMISQPQIESFFTQIREAFHFLEQQYGYRWLDEQLKYPQYWRNTVALSTYVSVRVGVQVWWYLADAAVGVSFIALQQPDVFPNSYSFYPTKDPNIPKAINLYILAEMRGIRDEANFLLGDTDKTRQYNKRAKLIEANMPGILEGLVRVTQKYAAPILQGDTSIFDEVRNYYLAKRKRLEPNLYIPGVKEPEESS